MVDFAYKHSIEGAKVEHETPSAILVVVDEEPIWFPKTQIDDESEVWREGHEGTLIVSEWIAKQKGLI